MATVVVLAALGVAGWRLTRSDDPASATPRRSAAEAEAAREARQGKAKRSTTTTSRPDAQSCGWIRACKVGASAGPAIVPGKGEAREGNSGTAMLTVPVVLYGKSTENVTVRWRTLFADKIPELPQAKPFEDYIENTGTVTFRPGETTQVVQIAINGNRGVEKDEFLLVSFIEPVNAQLGGTLGLGAAFILNDD
ncbi:MAG: hypothetical protein WKF43_14300 [Acidimicrobiales bacterium]